MLVISGDFLARPHWLALWAGSRLAHLSDRPF